MNEYYFSFLAQINARPAKNPMSIEQDNYSPLIHILFFVSCLVSTLASFFTIFIYFKYRQISRNYPARLIVLLSLSDVMLWGEFCINLFSKFVSPNSLQEENWSYCQFSAVFRCFWGLFNLCCIFMIGFSLFYEIMRTRRAENLERRGYLASISLSLVLALIPLALNEYGHLDPYQCWILNNKLNLTVFYGPVCIVVIADFIFILRVINFLKDLKGSRHSRNLTLKFLMFPTILVVAWLPGFIRMVGDFDNLALDGFMYIFMPIQGTMNPFIYGSIFTILKTEVIKKKDDVHHDSINKNLNILHKTSTMNMTYENILSVPQPDLKTLEENLLKTTPENESMSV